MPSAKTSLVIVESPSKAKTIGKYLGPGFTVKASMGHLRDLPKSTMGVNIENDFEPEYQPLKGKENVISDLKKSAAKAKNVYLATDPDREGEAISWHLKYLLDIPDDKTYRVTFNEITKDVVQTAIRQPRAIDQDLVDAQQARRVLDRIVGYEISPVLWKKVRRGLSAGRVQSVATRMVDDRDREIEQFQPQEYWSLDVKLARLGKPGGFTAHYFGDPKKRELKNEEEVQSVLAELKTGVYTVTSVKNGTKQYKPAPPFTTSTLQQEAFRKLGMSTRRTMMIAQQLYEGVELSGEGSVGLITYMRTDSLRISEQALSAAGGLVKSRYGSRFYEGPKQYKPKSGAQDAHEAIRPSNVLLTPEMVEKDLTKEQYRLYKLIWDRFVASQMANAVDDVTAIEVACGKHTFHANHQSRRFAGYTAVYEEGRDEEQEKTDSALPELTEGEHLSEEGYAPQQHFTQPPAHYTEATLVRAMEEQGIGRPSTYAPTVSTILDRNYVKKEGKALLITNLGRAVTKWMKNYFADIEDLKFTANMEQELDSIEEGKVPWKKIIRDFYGSFEQHVSQAEQGEREKIEPTVSDEICPLCGKHLVEREGRFGQFLGCSGFPECTFTMPLVEVMPGRCPKCGGRLMKRTGTSKRTNKQYTFYCCENTNSRDESARCDFMTWDVPTENDCQLCGQTMFKRSGRGAMKPFCINPACASFLPEEKRGYHKKPDASEEIAEEKPAEKKSAAKKPAAAKSAAKKPAAKKTGSRAITKPSARTSPARKAAELEKYKK